VQLAVAALCAVARWLRPRLAWLGRWTARAAADLARRASEHRAVVLAVLTRLLWWGALAVLVVAGRELFAGPAAGHTEARVLFLAGAGLLASCLVLLVGLERRLRWAAFGLGLGHASVAVLAWAALLH
jgi:hypothetical protein